LLPAQWSFENLHTAFCDPACSAPVTKAADAADAPLALMRIRNTIALAASLIRSTRRRQCHLILKGRYINTPTGPSKIITCMVKKLAGLWG